MFKDVKLAPLQALLIDMTFLEQYVENVVDYSSKYNSHMSILYAPENLIGKPARYPNFGDYPDTYMLRTYGKWWNESEGSQTPYMSQDYDIVSEDYVTVSFEYAVIPKSISIYETYNPGAIVRLWGKTTDNKWLLLWEAPPSCCIESSNVFRPPIKPMLESIKEVRIDFNQSMLQYHTALDAILLAGYKSNTVLQNNILESGVLIQSKAEKKNNFLGGDKLEYYVSPKPAKCEVNVEDLPGTDNFSKLPYEAVLHIFQYLDLRSLCRCAQVSQRFYTVSCDPALYRELSFKKYWHKVNNITLKHFTDKCKQIKKLDISWCGNKQITEEIFIQFLQICCGKLTHLSAGGCSFLKSSSLFTISSCCDLTELRLRNCCASGSQYVALSNLTKLTTLDVYCTLITDEVLIKILISNHQLKHIILDLCECLRKLDSIAETVRVNNKKLVTWSSWKLNTLTATGVEHLSHCSSLRELDVGWCLMLSAPENCLERVAVGCKDLRRLILCGWRGVSDHLLLPVIRSCKQLTQLDLLGIKNISNGICERILASLPKLQLLDISFCGSIDEHQVSLWREQYPDVTIQRSCSITSVNHY